MPDNLDKYSLDEPIKYLKSFNFPFVFCYSEEEESQLIEQANRIRESANNYLKFLEYSKSKK